MLRVVVSQSIRHRRDAAARRRLARRADARVIMKRCETPRRRQDVYTASTAKPCARSNCPARFASAMPSLASDASSQPVNNPNLLCSVRPWRKMTIASLAANAAGWHVDCFGILVTTRSAGRPMYNASTAG